jgi:hypothetical protein
MNYGYVMPYLSNYGYRMPYRMNFSYAPIRRYAPMSFRYSMGMMRRY